MSRVLFASNAVCKKEYRDILHQETSGRLQIPMGCKDSKLIKGTTYDYKGTMSVLTTAPSLLPFTNQLVSRFPYSSGPSCLKSG